MEFSRQEYWSGMQFPSPGGLPDPGILSRILPDSGFRILPDPGVEPGSPSLKANSLPTELWGKPY